MDNYVQIMLESLRRKEELLDRIIGKNEEQAELIRDKQYEDINWDAFDLIVTEKEILIDRINTMDEGFQNLYDRLKEQLVADKDKYAEAIKVMQEIIVRLTDKGVAIRTGEERNRRTIDAALAGRKKTIRKTRNSLKVADSYHQAMSMNYGENYSAVNNKK